MVDRVVFEKDGFPTTVSSDDKKVVVPVKSKGELPQEFKEVASTDVPAKEQVERFNCENAVLGGAPDMGGMY